MNPMSLDDERAASALPAAGGTNARLFHFHLLQQRAAGGTGSLPLMRYLGEADASPVRPMAPTLTLAPYVHLGSPTAGASTAHESAAQFWGPAPMAPLPTGVYPDSEPLYLPFACLVFEKLSKKRCDHPCQYVRLGDMLDVLTHIVKWHIDTCCPICYRELLRIKDLDSSHLKKAVFGAIEDVIAHIRWIHTKPWFCRVCDLRFGAKTKYNLHMRMHPDHETLERKAISGYYDEEMRSSDKKLGKCTNKEALDDWELDCPAENRNRAGPNDSAFQTRTGPREDCALLPPAAPTVGLQSQPSQAGGNASSHWSEQYPTTYWYPHEHLAPTYHHGSAQSSAIYAYGSTPAEEPIQDPAEHFECDPAQGRRRLRYPYASPNNGEFRLQPDARQVGGYAGSHRPPESAYRYVAPAYHRPDSSMRSPTVYTHVYLATEEPIQGDSWAVELAFGMFSSACLID